MRLKACPHRDNYGHNWKDCYICNPEHILASKRGKTVAEPKTEEDGCDAQKAHIFESMMQMAEEWAHLTGGAAAFTLVTTTRAKVEYETRDFKRMTKRK